MAIVVVVVLDTTFAITTVAIIPQPVHTDKGGEEGITTQNNHGTTPYPGHPNPNLA